MIMDRHFKIVLTFIGVGLWLISFKLWFLPQEVMAEDVDIESRLSYISKIVGTIESSVIKIEGDLRVVKRQADISMMLRDLSEKRLNALERSVGSIEMDVAEMDGNIAYIESDIDGLASGTCDNIFLCRQKKY